MITWEEVVDSEPIYRSVAEFPNGTLIKGKYSGDLAIVYNNLAVYITGEKAGEKAGTNSSGLFEKVKSSIIQLTVKQ